MTRCSFESEVRGLLRWCALLDLIQDKQGTAEGTGPGTVDNESALASGLGQELGQGQGQGQGQRLEHCHTGLQAGIVLSLLSGWYGNVHRYGGFFQRHCKRYIDRLMDESIGGWGDMTGQPLYEITGR